MLRDRIDHLKNFICGLLCRHCLHVLRLDDILIHTVTDQFFQLAVNIAHIRSGFAQKKLHDRTCDILPLFFQTCQDPACQKFLCLCCKLHNLSYIFHCLIELRALVHFLLHKKKQCRIRNLRHILCQLLTTALKKAAVFNQDHSPVGKKRKGFRQVDHLFRICVFSLISGKIHRIIGLHQRFFQLVFVLFFQVRLVAVEQIYLFKLSTLNIFINRFHFRLLSNQSVLHQFIM